MSFLRRGPDRADVEEKLESTRGVVEILKLSRANLRSADAVLNEAATLLEGKDVVNAAAAIDRAERIANSLEADYRAATSAVEAVRGYMDQLKSLGVPVNEEEKALGEIHGHATAKRDFEGTRVPDYEGARRIAEETHAQVEAKFALAHKASDAIFSAELSLERGADAFPSGTVDTLQEGYRLLEQARAKLATESFDHAATDASLAEQVALGVLDQLRKAEGTIASVERLLAGLRGLGISVGPIANSMETGKALLARGKLVAASETLEEAAKKAIALGTGYRDLLETAAVSRRSIDELRAESLPTTEAEGALARAKAAMKAGNFKLARSGLDDVAAAVKRAREQRDGLRTWLAETKARVAELKAAGASYVNDVEEMVGKAEQEFANADYAAATEDLRIAVLLMKPAVNGKVRDGPEIPR